MTSVTLPRRAHHLRSIREHRNHHSCQTDLEDTNHQRLFPNQIKLNVSTKALSYDENDMHSSLPTSPTTNNNNNSNRLKDLCTRLKRRFILTKENRTRSEDIQSSPSERRIVRFGNYESFSSSTDDPSSEFVWPDFEQVYDTIPSCLINALPGPDDFSVDIRCQDSLDPTNFQTDLTDEDSNEQMNLFTQCQRGKSFRRNGICHKLDKSQYNSQLDTFVQQLMVEKLMRTWT
ncbi:hypothetical protein I4U23_007363 [Adineta vaga]|nr:hypothetical protein I4U23_007363 [Adineta vaga]